MLSNAPAFSGHPQVFASISGVGWFSRSQGLACSESQNERGRQAALVSLINLYVPGPLAGESRDQVSAWALTCTSLSAWALVASTVEAF